MNAAILLPEDEDVPPDAASVFKEFCQFCDEHRELFFSSDRSDLTNTELSSMIQAQATALVKIASATQEYSEYLRELKKRKPELANRLP